MKNKILKIVNLIAIVVFAFLVVFLALINVYGVKLVNAASVEEVISDLYKDKEFKESDYPYVGDDYGLHVIQIAESSNDELFIYVYQPCHDTYDLIGTKISISYGYSKDGSGLSPQLYNLRLVSTSGTLDKYYVQGYTVPNYGDRYYNIVEIFRMVNTDIDKDIDPTFPKTDIAYSVGQQWHVYDFNGSKRYGMNTFDTLYVETVFNGNFTFSDGFRLKDLIGTDEPTDCWFYCFNVDDYVIRHIFDADLNYSSRHVREQYYPVSGNRSYTYSNEKENQVITLKDSDMMSYVSPGLGAPDLEWNRILSSEEFLKTAESQDVEITSLQREKIESSQWVFTYLETERTDDAYGSNMTGGRYHIYNYEDIYDVGLLRLHFQDISGKYYDLGVVNDLTDPDNISDGGTKTDLLKAFEEFWEMFMKVILLIVGLFFLLLLIQFVPGIKSFMKWIFGIVKDVISAPFKLLKSIFKKSG